MIGIEGTPQDIYLDKVIYGRGLLDWYLGKGTYGRVLVDRCYLDKSL